MAVFRDWPRTLRPASYRGVGFFVESDDIETGRRLEVHEFPHADAPYVEDLGRKANKINVTAYVLSDNADGEAKALLRACDAGGAALLSLPIERLTAHCESCRRSFSKDKLGYIAFSLAFVRDGLTAGPFPVGFLSSVVSGLMVEFKGISAAFVARGFSGLGVAGFVRDAARADAQGIAALADGILRSGSFQAPALPGLLARVQALYDAAGALTASGATGHSYSTTSYVAAAADVSTAPLAAAIFEMVSGIGGAAEGDIFAALQVFTDYEPEDAASPATPSRQRQSANAACLASLVRVSALAALAQRVAETRYTDRRQVISARAQMSESFALELSRLDTARDNDVYVALSDISGRTAEYLTRLFADLAPVVVVEAPRSLPSLWWAQRLYGDAARASELSIRNTVKHPGFMPLSFEALAR